MGQKLKITNNNIIRLWFGANTPIRKFQIKYNPDLWAACLQVSKSFRPPSGATSLLAYSKADRLLFAKAVQREMTVQYSFSE